MALVPGTRLGPYEIQSLVGSGGMGEVYRARDTRLDRTVAVKVLGPELAAEPDRRARFEREARAVSSLNHPHSCALYDVGHQDGVEYLVLEFIEGETLDARLTRGPLPLDQALRYGIEVCDALEQAHRQGLTHRDLKPGNVMLTASGTKLLDLGLAKPPTPVLKTGGGAPAPRGTIAATRLSAPLTDGLTGTGTILGTIEYMAPEQVEGRSTDARTDIWAVGCLLYEMICGARAFKGATPASVLAAILEREPTPVEALASGESGRLWDVIRMCLDKNPDGRWQSARDLARELRWCAEQVAVSGGQPAGAQPTAPRNRMSRRTVLTAGAIALTFAIALSALRMVRSLSGEVVGGVAAGPPVIILMDSTHPERIYDQETRKAGGTNADDLTDLLRDLPVRLVKENTSATWHREYEVLQETPALIVAHRSCFYDATMLGEASRQRPFVDLSWDKFEVFAGLIAVGNPRTKILAYSRGSWRGDTMRAQWVTSMEQRFPPLRGRLDAMKVRLDRATFRNKVTAAELRSHVVAMLGLDAKRGS